MSKHEKESGRRAVLTGSRLGFLLRQLLVTSVPPGGVARRVGEAEEAIAAKLDAKLDVDTGNFSWSLDLDKEKMECWFDDRQLYGVKVALVQAVNGTQQREPATHGVRKYTIEPIARELGILRAVQKDTKPEQDEDDFKIETDDELDEKAKKRVVDLDDSASEGTPETKPEGILGDQVK